MFANLSLVLHAAVRILRKTGKHMPTYNKNPELYLASLCEQYREIYSN